MTKKSPSPRRLARRFALQALYQWKISETPTAQIELEFIASKSLHKIDVPYFLDLLHQIPKCVNSLDDLMKPILDRPIDELNPIELTILRMGIYEILHRPNVPYRVIIDEALRLSKTFGTVQGFKYVNAILDRIAKKIRATEYL